MDTTDRKVVFLKLDDILPNRFQPRIKFDEQALNELANSIKEHGVLSPITVRPLGNKYEIVAGERRYKASTMAGLTEIPAMVIKMDDKESAEIALIENVQRKDLTPIEEAISYKKIFDMNIGISQDMLAKKMGKSQSAIANKLRLLNLSDEVQEALLENKISERHARSLLRIKDKKIQNMLLNRIINERLTVRRTDEEIINMLNNNKDIEILDFEDQNAPLKRENINNPLNRFENLYNLPKTQIIEDKEDEFIPTIPDVTSFEVPPFKDLESANKEILPKIHSSIEYDTLSPQENPKINFGFPDIAKMEEPQASKENLPKTHSNLEDTLILKENPKTNPGFLDIDRIEEKATDINENKNKISLEELLKMPDKKEENIIEPVNNNRFFTMVENEDESGNTTVKFEANNLLKQNNLTNETVSEQMPDLSFDSKFIPQEKSIFEQLEAKENIEEKSELSGFDNEIFNTPNVPNLLKNDTPLEETKQPNLDNFNNNFNNNFSNNFNNLFENSNPVDMNTEPRNIFNNEPINDEFNLPKSDIIEDEESVSTNIDEIKPVPPMDYGNSINSTFDYKPVYDIDEDVIEEKHDNSKYGAADLKTIINTVRKCAETIEKYGYVIDTEEFDFEDMYQVIFKIEKKH